MPIGLLWASQVAEVVKNPPPSTRDGRDTVSKIGLGRSPGGGHGHPPQCSCLENPMDRGAWRDAVHGVRDVTEATEHSVLAICMSS